MKQKLFDKFAELFGNSDGAHFYFSPGRVNLIGEHTANAEGPLCQMAALLKAVAGILPKDGTDFVYTRFLLETRTVTDKLYFYPISNTEKFKNPSLGQNPGW